MCVCVSDFSFKLTADCITFGIQKEQEEARLNEQDEKLKKKKRKEIV